MTMYTCQQKKKGVMSMPTIERISRKELSLYDLIMSGEAARICGVDRRTFMSRVKTKENPKGEIAVAAMFGDRMAFERKDVEALAKKIQAEKKK